MLFEHFIVISLSKSSQYTWIYTAQCCIDIAVGAPYEDLEKGVVYIYHGRAGDMDTKFSQRIAASEIDAKLRGFGFHISQPFDVDRNTYNGNKGFSD